MHGHHRRTAFRIHRDLLHAHDVFNEEHPHRFSARLRTEDVRKLQHRDVHIIGKRHCGFLLVDAAFDIRMPLREFLLGPLLGGIGEIRAADRHVLHAAFAAQSQKPLDRVDVVFLVEIIDRRGTLHALVHARRKDEAITAPKMLFQLFVAHLQIVAEFELHFGRQYRALRQRRQRQRRYLVTPRDQLLCRLRAQKPRSADHKYLHAAYLPCDIDSLSDFMYYYIDTVLK